MATAATIALPRGRYTGRRRVHRNQEKALWARNAGTIHQAKYWVMYSPASATFDSNMMKMTLWENSC
ncbi:hypothetical protein D3C81_1279610 [compost metagenome]